jgi:hypothetical protein
MTGAALKGLNMVRRADFEWSKTEVEVIFDVVSIKIHCGDDYTAQVVYDDLIERMQSGEGFLLKMEPSRAKSDKPA